MFKRLARRPSPALFIALLALFAGTAGVTYAATQGPPSFTAHGVASVPAGQTIQFKFIKIAANGTVTWEAGSNHSYTVPTSGTGFVTVSWQY